MCICSLISTLEISVPLTWQLKSLTPVRTESQIHEYEYEYDVPGCLLSISVLRLAAVVPIVDTCLPREQNDAAIAEDAVQEQLARVILTMRLGCLQPSDLRQPARHSRSVEVVVYALSWKCRHSDCGGLLSHT